MDEFNAEQYKDAAEELIDILPRLYELGYYVLAAYAAGVAVESMLRAYRCRINPEFDARHDLHELLKASNIKRLLTPAETAQCASAAADVAIRWSNSHRYRSEKALRSFFRTARLNRGVRGDFVKENVRRAVIAAAFVVRLGVERWTKFSES